MPKTLLAKTKNLSECKACFIAYIQKDFLFLNYGN